MKPAEVREQIAAGDTGPLYLLQGDDLHSRLELAAAFAALVEEGLQAFNVQSFHANETATAGARDQLIGELLSAARTLPMMAPRRVLTVHAAERLLSPRKGRDEEPDLPFEGGRRGRRGRTPVEELEQYLAAPEPLTTIVFVAGDLDANRRLAKLVRKHAAVVDCGSLDTVAAAAKWIKEQVATEQLSMEPAAVSLLLEATGLSLSRIRAEIDKLVLFAAGESVIRASHVRELVLPRAEPGEDFPLGRAIWSSNVRDALDEIAAQLGSGIQAPMILGQIRAAAGRLKPDDRARDALDAVFETDIALKSSGGEPRFLLERLVIDLCARR